MADLMADEAAWRTLLRNFDLQALAINRFAEDYNVANDLMASNVNQIKSVASTQNKMYRNHTDANLRCYINTAQLNRVLAFHKWTTYAIKDAGEEYDDASATAFDLDWVNSIVDEYLREDPVLTPQSTAFSVLVPQFIGTNWHDVKDKIIALLTTRIGNAGIPLTYLVRENRLDWEDTENMKNL